MKFDVEYIDKLIQLANEGGLSELTLQDGEKAIVLRKELGQVAMSSVVQVPQAQVPSVMSAPAQEQKSAPAVDNRKPVISPMVGTFYKSPSPNAKPFVSIGESVAPGQVVCIIEAMKLMNEIESEVSGRIVEICVEDGQPVEYGQVIMYVE